MTPITMSFSDGSNGSCKLTNKRGAWKTEVPAIVSVRKSDDDLKFDCTTEDGRNAVGQIKSEMGAKIIASAVFLDFGITDAITDKHRQYIDSYVIPVKALSKESMASEGSSKNDYLSSGSKYDELDRLVNLRDRGVLTQEEFEIEKRKVLSN